MIFNLLTSALLLQSTEASFSADASGVSSAASHLASQVNAWDSGAGLIGALPIQGYFPTLQSSVNALSSDVGSISDSDVDVGSVTSFGEEVANLLKALTNKASDFSSAGATSLVSNDVKNIEGPAEGIVNGLINAVKGDCDKVKSLTSVLNEIESGFTSVASAYNIAAPSFSAAPKC